MDGAAMFAPLSADEVAKPAASARPGSGDRTPIIPVPTDAPPMNFKMPKLGGEPSRSWQYRDEHDQLVGYVCRWDFIGEDGKPTKEVLPVTYCDIGEGRRRWRSKGMPSPRPLFDLPGILARADAPILVCEGEKTRDAAAILFPAAVATTPAHGAKSPHLTDFGPCARRVVIIATDHDEPGLTNAKGKPHHPGQDFGDEVCRLTRAAGAASVLHLHPVELGRYVWADGEKVERSAPLKDGWDLADAIDEGWTPERVAPDLLATLAPYLNAAERKAERQAMGEDPPDEEEFEGWPFRVEWNGVEKRIERVDKETGIVTVEWRWFCSVLEVTAETRSADGEEWGRLLIVTDRDDARKEWAMPMAMLAGDGVGYRERLLSLGLIMAPSKFARDALHEYVSTARPDVKARCVIRGGWQAHLSFIRFDQQPGALS